MDYAYGHYPPSKWMYQKTMRSLWRRRLLRMGRVVLVAVLLTAFAIYWAGYSSQRQRQRHDLYFKSILERGEHPPVSTQYLSPPHKVWRSAEESSTSSPGDQKILQESDDATLLDPPSENQESPVGPGADAATPEERRSQINLIRQEGETLKQASGFVESNVAIDDTSKPKRIDVEEEEATMPSGQNDKTGGLVEDESNESKQHLTLEELAETLPEYIYVPFEEAVKDEVLQGWEDDWISHGAFDAAKWGALKEPNVDFVYLWVNGSEESFQDTLRPWEQRSVLNDPEGKWLASHGTNRYRDWDELRYSFRSIEKNAGHFMNNIKVLVNSIYQDGVAVRKQTPSWLSSTPEVQKTVQVVSQEEMFESDKAVCLPTFNSLTIENQMFNTESEVDQFFAMSDDMLLTREHAPSDIYSPLFGSALSFKTNGYSTTSPPTEVDARRFGEKPYLIYTSWLLNRRFGVRKRKGQSHFGHSLSRSIMREAIESFPRPELRSACKRFRGEPGFQLYSWYVAYHYQIERHREALLWSYIMLRSDVDRDGMLSWSERQTIVSELNAGAENADRSSFRRKVFYHVPSMLQKAGLAPPKVNTNALWTSLDGPMAIRDADCSEFNVDECLAPGFLTETSNVSRSNPTFSSAVIFDRLARQNPKCGDCLLKGLLQQTPKGLEPLLPRADTQPADRELIVKAMMRYKYIVVDPSDTLFVMVTDADQIDSTLSRQFVKEKRALPGQMCLNDDVATTDEQELKDVQAAMKELFEGLFPNPSTAERTG